MLRPAQVIEWFKARSAKGQGELSQLLDGLLVGGQIIIGGSEQNVQRANAFMATRTRLGRVVPLSHARLDVDIPTTFDTAAVCQLIMMAKNEAFHLTIQQAIGMLTQVAADGHDLSVGVQLLQEQADKIAKL